MSNSMAVTDATFVVEIEEHKGLAVVDFWAAWCGPCRTAAPEVEKTAAEMAGRAIVLKVDTEAHPQIAAEFNVQSIPNFVVLKDGRLVSQQAGLVPSARMKEWLVRAGAGAPRSAAS